jgi:hypothetical protein
MKTSDLPAYTHIETITAGSSVLNYRGLLITCTDFAESPGPGTIQGTTWYKDSSGNYTSFSFPVDSGSTRDLTAVIAFSPRTITNITSGYTVYGLR